MKLIYTLFYFSPFTIFAQEINCVLPYNPFGEIISHTYYDLQYSEKHEQAYWVAYMLTPEFLVKNVKRSNRFKEDTTVPTGSASLSDYKYSGYDRGHLAPAGSMTFDKTAMDESFLMSNMSPQVSGFNRGIWKKLESKVRAWTMDSDSLFVVTGPVLTDIQKTIGENKVSVPNAYYKVLLRFDDSKTSAIAFLLANEKSNTPLSSFAVSIDSVEVLTGIDFNPGINSDVEVELESGFDLGKWGLE